MLDYIKRTYESCIRNDAEGRQGGWATLFRFSKYFVALRRTMLRSTIVLVSITIAYWGMLELDWIPQHYSSIICQSTLFAGFMWVLFAGMTQSFHDECSRYTKRVEQDVCERVERLLGSVNFCYVNKLPCDDETFISRCLPAPFIPPRVASA